MNELFNLQVVMACFDDFPEAFIPERWSMEGLAILTENMV